MRKSLLATIVVVTLSPIVGAEPCDSLRSIRWILGAWVAESGERTTLESWQELSPQTFEGRGEIRSTATSELLFGESLRIVEMSGELFYLVKVNENDLPVAFKSIECSETGAVFVNADHDFPRRLEYRVIGADRMVVLVSDGADEGFEIRFTRRSVGQR